MKLSSPSWVKFCLRQTGLRVFKHHQFRQFRCLDADFWDGERFPQAREAQRAEGEQAGNRATICANESPLRVGLDPQPERVGGQPAIFAQVGNQRMVNFGVITRRAGAVEHPRNVQTEAFARLGGAKGDFGAVRFGFQR